MGPGFKVFLGNWGLQVKEGKQSGFCLGNSCRCLSPSGSTQGTGLEEGRSR
jgi:hypothetical protein